MPPQRTVVSQSWLTMVRKVAMRNPQVATRRASFRTMVQLLADLVRGHRVRVCVAAALLLAAGVVNLAQPWVVRNLLSHPTRFSSSIPFLILLVVVSAAANAVGQFQLARVAEGVVRDARLAMTHRVLRLPMPTFRRFDPGDLVARVSGDTVLLKQLVQQVLVQSVISFFVLAGALLLMLFLDAVLLCVSVLVIAVLIAAIGAVLPRIRDASYLAQTSVGTLASTLERSLAALSTVKTCGAEAAEDRRMGEAAGAAFAHGVRRARWDATASSIATMAMQLVFLTVLGVGGLRVADGAIPVATLVSFLLYVLFLAEPVVSLIGVGSCVQTVASALDRIGEITRLDEEPLADAASPEPLSQAPFIATRPILVFDNVSIRYPGRNDLALNGFTLRVPARGLTALVGPSGAGKSTVLALVEHLITPDAGTITFAGHALTDWRLSELRASIGYVEQDAPVLAGTLRENLTYGATEASETEVHEVIRRTRLDSLLRRLDGNLDAEVRYRGVSLSGGERQRIAIARALLRRPRLLLLDEATSQLDATSEAALRDVIGELAGEMAVLAVAHRLSTIRDASVIAIVRDGRVLDSGTHQELQARCGLYAELIRHQMLAGSELTRGQAPGRGLALRPQ